MESRRCQNDVTAQHASHASGFPLTPDFAEPKPRASRWLLLTGIGLALLVLLIFKPPFVIRPLPRPAVPGAAEPPAVDAAAAFVDPIWTSKVLPTIEAKAQDIAAILPEIRANPQEAGEKYGRHDATNPYSYMVKGTGKVAEINTQSQAGTVLLEVPGLSEKVALQVGPVVRGTAVRDATGLVSFNQFSNQLDYADVSKEMNTRALKSATAGLEAQAFPAVDKTVSFFGVMTFDPHAKGPVLITPTKVLTAVEPPTAH